VVQCVLSKDDWQKRLRRDGSSGHAARTHNPVNFTVPPQWFGSADPKGNRVSGARKNVAGKC
jgi:hypothetical protein